ncbi:hypothetical protein LTR10_004160 [Elasticomyces elasticus]|nr:hypothetical protein LTR10_004160 [Elasticomyces elasticus]KAK4977657.1 hypothetical protein LTR42_002028 [Elasticomyces elasticus]
MSGTDAYPQYLKDIHYSDDSDLNTLEICIPQPPFTTEKQVWLIFIHGGAWQDPGIDASSFRKTQELLLKSEDIKNIYGLASINYRLSPYPSHPKDPSNPSDPSRNAKHPVHINDVLAAILFLQEKYHFEDRYILAGHSCGATLAFQVAMKRYWGSQYESTFALEMNVVPPMAVLAVEGIYDIPAMIKHHSRQPEYKEFVTNAFGSDEAVWKAASPVHGDYDDSWPDGTVVVLAHSYEDELVEWEQVELMYKAMKTQGWEEGLKAPSKKRWLDWFELGGKHDEVWKEYPTELERAIKATVRMVMGKAPGIGR